MAIVDVPRTEAEFGATALAADVTGLTSDDFHILNPPDQTTILVVRNAGGSAHNVTIMTPSSVAVFGGAAGEVPVTAGTEVINILASVTRYIALPPELNQDIGTGARDTVVFEIDSTDLHMVGLGMTR